MVIVVEVNSVVVVVQEEFAGVVQVVEQAELEH